MDFVATEASKAVNEAIDRLQPAWLKIATGEAQGKIAFNYYAPELYDRRMSIIQAVTPQGKTIATLVNYAIHPEVIGNGAGILSPDLVGPLCEKLEARTGGIALFMNGRKAGWLRPTTVNSTNPATPCAAIGPASAPGTSADASAN